jgi:sugar transferase (PEP-CTERM/EpsH1 system associated)
MRMRILILAPTLPYPPNWGLGIRVYQVLRLLARRHAVSLLAYAGPEDQEKIQALERLGAAVHVVPHPDRGGGGKRVAQLLSMGSPASYQRSHIYSAQMQQQLSLLSARDNYDVIQVETSPLAGFEFDRRAAVALIEHDIVYELLQRMCQTERSPLRRLFNRIEFRKVKREEIASWRTVAGCVTTSAREEQIVRQLAPDTPVAVVPNAVDVDYFLPSDGPIDETAIVMTGFMKTRPNIDGAVYFVREILPRILTARPQTVFYIVGGGAPAEVEKLAGPNVVVTGEVPDVRPYVHKAAVVVVPLRMGGGTRLKVLEGLSMRKPMVSTALGCEGIDVAAGEHLLVADEPEAFAASVIELLRDRRLAERLATGGRAVVLRHYRWETAVDRLEAFYEQLRHAASRRDAK